MGVVNKTVFHPFDVTALWSQQPTTRLWLVLKNALNATNKILQ